MLSVSSFFARARWGTQWGVVDVMHPTGHRGHDIVCAVHEDEPALRGGRVVTKGYSSVLGNYSVIEVNASTFDYYCHQYATPTFDSRHPLGVIAAGERVGQAAGPGDIHGSAWTGTHLHYGSGPALASVVTGATYNATQIIAARLASSAPAGDGATAIVSPPKERDHMQLIGPDQTGTSFISVDGIGQYTVPNADWLALWQRFLGITPGLLRTDLDGAAQFLSVAPTYKSYWRPPVSGGGAVPADYVSDADLAAAVQALQAGDAANQTALLAAISQVDENTLATFGLKRI
jgi:hypothetical protein